MKFHLGKIRSESQSCQIFVNSLDLNLQTQAFHGSNVLLLKLFVDEVISDFTSSSESDPIRIFKSKTEFFNLALQKPENILAESAAQVILVSSLASFDLKLTSDFHIFIKDVLDSFKSSEKAEKSSSNLRELCPVLPNTIFNIGWEASKISCSIGSDSIFFSFPLGRIHTSGMSNLTTSLGKIFLLQIFRVIRKKFSN